MSTMLMEALAMEPSRAAGGRLARAVLSSLRLNLDFNAAAAAGEGGDGDGAPVRRRPGEEEGEDSSASAEMGVSVLDAGLRGVVWARLLRLDLEQETRLQEGEKHEHDELLRGTGESALEERRRNYSLHVTTRWLGVPAAQQNSPAAATATGTVDLTQSLLDKAARDDEALRQQVSVDIPRTVPQSRIHSRMFERDPRLRQALERILFCYDQEYPDAGYFQGLGDIAVIFFLVNLARFVDIERDLDGSPQGQARPEGPVPLSDVLLHTVEADTYSGLICFMKPFRTHMGNIQAGIDVLCAGMIAALRERDGGDALLAHLAQIGVEPLFFCVRWMICLLTRELPYSAAVCLFDIYIAAEHLCENAIPALHPVVCAELLLHFRAPILECQDISACLKLLQQDLPALAAASVTESDINAFAASALRSLSAAGALPGLLP